MIEEGFRGNRKNCASSVKAEEARSSPNGEYLNNDYETSCARRDHPWGLFLPFRELYRGDRARDVAGQERSYTRTNGEDPGVDAGRTRGWLLRQEGGEHGACELFTCAERTGRLRTRFGEIVLFQDAVRLINCEFAGDFLVGDAFLNAREQIHFERFADVVAGEVFNG